MADEKKKEPESFRDLMWFKRTSGGWFDGNLTYKSLIDRDSPDWVEGCVDSESLHLDFTEDSATVKKHVHRVKEILGPKHASFIIDYEPVETFDDIDEFKKSEYYGMMMRKWGYEYSDASFDSSFMDSGEAEFSDRDIFVRFETTNMYTDWLGNTRDSGKSKEVRFFIERMGGYTEIEVGDDSICTELDEIIEAVRMKQKMEELGIEINFEDGSVTVPFANKKEER